ncbi:MAG: helix-turn-helix transcriptional regulator [Clostridia bacterium]|nr:helix-turn-helix transcriptional regulator [Clostridia bacterium]
MKPETLSFVETPKQKIHMEHTVTNGFTMPYMHTHVEYEFLYIRDGSVTVENNVHRVSVTAPCVIVHRPFMLHRAYTPEKCRYERYIINFGTDIVARISAWIPHFDRILNSSMCIVDLDPALHLQLSTDIALLWQSYQDHNYVRAELEFALLLNHFTDCIAEGQIRNVRDEHTYISDVMDYICHHFGEPLLTEDISRQFFVSRAKLTSDFKSCTNITIKQYIQLTRINYAKQMLLSGVNLSEVAQNCGFCDDSHFIHTFRSIVGQTPRAFALGTSPDITG